MDAFGAANVEALLEFYAFPGAHVTDRFAGKGKLTCWQAMSSCSMELILAIAALGTSRKLRVDSQYAIKTFSCQFYELVSLWWMSVTSGGSFSLRNI